MFKKCLGSAGKNRDGRVTYLFSLILISHWILIYFLKMSKFVIFVNFKKKRMLLCNLKHNFYINIIKFDYGIYQK